MKKTIICLIISSLSMSVFASDLEGRRHGMRHDVQGEDLRVDQRLEEQKYQQKDNEEAGMISEKRHQYQKHQNQKYQERDYDRNNHKEKVIMRFEKRHNHNRDRVHHHLHKMKQEEAGYKLIRLPNEMQKGKMLPNESLVDKVPVHKLR